MPDTHYEPNNDFSNDPVVIEEQGVPEPAGFWRRLLALIIDGIIAGVVASILFYVLFRDPEVLTLNNEYWSVRDSWTSFISGLYAIILPIIWNGQTIGKRALSIRIIKVNGEKIGIGTMLLRVLVSNIVYALTLGIAFIVSVFMVLIREDKRSVHDFIAGTYVGKVERYE
ncbi:MAG: RDD family protein [Desulfitobacteriia bacterium]|jgi:uncharacterized RDD family membrane protein YckC